MARRPVTITLDEETAKKLHALQASIIASSNMHWSFSAITNLILEEGLKRFPKNKKLSKHERNNYR